MIALPSTFTTVPELISLRRGATLSFAVLLWGLLALNTVFAFQSGMSIWVTVSISLLSAIIGTFTAMRMPSTLAGRLTIVVCLMNSYDVAIFATSFTPYQLDAHMLYFVIAALLIGYCCWITLLSACLHTAVQHFMFNLFIPQFLYPGGADWERFFYHATILIVQLVGSMMIAVKLHRLFVRSHEMIDEVQEASTQALLGRQREDEQRSAANAERERIAHMLSDAAEKQTYVVESIAAGLEKLSLGKLSYRIHGEFTSAYEKLRTSFNESMDRLEVTIRSVSAGSLAIQSDAGEISDAIGELSRRTERQAEALEETVSSLGEITETVRLTAVGAKQASRVVAIAKQDAEKGGEVVRAAISSMNGIEQSSRQITDIIGVIDDIAFRTNLLALNAGVEAARAGEAGRGFAVVATEVRELAQRSAVAAKEINILISTSMEQVDKGVKLVAATGESLERIVTQITDINTAVDDISTRAQEQAGGLQSVNATVAQMDNVTQQNAAMVEETTAAARTLSEKTLDLGTLIGQFETTAGNSRADNTKLIRRRA